MNISATLEVSKSWPKAFLAVAILIWYGLYQSLIPISEWLVSLLPIDRKSQLGDALQFFLYDTPKVLLLLTGVVFVMGMINSYFTPERTRVLLAGKSEGVGNVMAASLGIVTPFCSCSAVPLFIGFVQAGVPLGITFSFLISAPMVNEVALTLLFTLFGWKIAGLYLILGFDDDNEPSSYRRRRQTGQARRRRRSCSRPSARPRQAGRPQCSSAPARAAAL
jgi:uncharacterized membrane protein YraQ (UPF0718 family)